MDFREYMNQLEKKGAITKIGKEVSIDIETAAVLKTAEPTPLLFENVKGFPNYRVAGNIFSTKNSIANYFGITTDQLIPRLTEAIDKRSLPEVIDNAPCQEVVVDNVDLDTLPILKHNERDGGRYRN